MTSTTRNASLGLTAAGIVLLAVLQFLPWATFASSAFGSSSETTVTTWQGESEGSAFGFSGSDRTGWYDNDADDASGVGLLRIAIPFLLAAMALTAAGVLLSMTQRNPVGGILGILGAVSAVTGTLLFAMGTDRFFGDADYTWHAGFYVALVATLCLLGGSLAAFATGSARRSTS